MIFAFSGCAALIENEPGYTTLESRKKYIQENPETPKEIQEKIIEQKIVLGMTKSQALASWGKPESINRTVSKDNVSEQWVYSSTILYFDNDELTTFQDY